MDQLGIEVDVGPFEAVELGSTLAAVEGDRIGHSVVGVERGDQQRGLKLWRHTTTPATA